MKKNKKYYLKTFKIYSSKSDEDLLPLINNYIESGRGRRAIFKALIIILISSCIIGTISAFFRVFLEFRNSGIISGISGGLIGAVSAAIMVRIQRNDIKDFLKHQ